MTHFIYIHTFVLYRSPFGLQVASKLRRAQSPSADISYLTYSAPTVTLMARPHPFAAHSPHSH
ncbi:MAG TPA: hypothetical protein VGG64_10640 [Pirellulales bacterium]|jgi:hypothetical protein